MHFARGLPGRSLLLNARLLVAAAVAPTVGGRSGDDGWVNCRPKRCLPIKLNARPAARCTCTVAATPSVVFATLYPARVLSECISEF